MIRKLQIPLLLSACLVAVSCSDSGKSVMEPEFEPAVRIKTVQAEYPRIAQSAGMEGEVKLRFTVKIDGHTADIIVTEESGANAGFEESAIFAVREWEYLPARLNGIPVSSQDTATVSFTLSR